METLKKSGINKVAHGQTVDGKMACLDSIADFVSVQTSRRIAGLDEHRQINVGVAQHLEQFMTGRDGPGLPCLKIGAGEDFAERQPFGCDVMISERVGDVGVIEYTQPPTSGRGILAGADECEIRIRSPDWGEVPMYLRLKRRERGLYVGVAQYRALID